MARLTAYEKFIPDYNSKPSRRRRWIIGIGVAIAICIIIAIVVPVVIVTRKKPTRSTVILPLYIYPETNSTWNPLYESVKAHPSLDFLVVINPRSGPGLSQLPDENYIPQIERLNSLENVKTVGYVRTGYATRNITDVVNEVNVYAGWSSSIQSLAMHGIFFDEAPHVYSAAAVEFMITANKAVKDASGLLGDRTIIHNPGVIPDSQYDDKNTDITVIFEQSYDEFGIQRADVQKLPGHSSEYSIMVHSVPELSESDMDNFVNELGKTAEYLFVTTNNESYYESFGSDWSTFTNVV